MRTTKFFLLAAFAAASAFSQCALVYNPFVNTWDCGGASGTVGGATNLTVAGAIPFVSSPGVLTTTSNGLFYDAANQRLAFGFNTGLNEAFEVRKSITSASGNTYGIRSTFTLDLPTNSYQYSALLGEAIVPSGNSSNFTGLVRGSYSYVRHDGSGTISEAAASYPIMRVNNNGSITDAYSWLDSVAVSNTASIGNLYHLQVSPAVKNGSGTVGTEYGLYIGDITAPVAANRWAIYTVGSTNKIHFSGPIDSDQSMEMNGSARFRADGTESAPSFATSANGNMGMYRAANNTLGWSIGGAERIRLSSNGNLLIGTKSEGNYKLDVASSDSSGTMRVYDARATIGVTNLLVKAGAGQSTTDLQQWQANGGTVLARVTSGGDIAFRIATWGSGTEGTCDATTRGQVVMVQGGTGVADTLRVCAKDAADAYAWTALY